MSVATEMRDKYIAAETAILEGKEYRLGERILRMEDLAEIRAGRKEWEARAAAESAGSNVNGARIGGLSVSVARFDR